MEIELMFVWKELVGIDRFDVYMVFKDLGSWSFFKNILVFRILVVLGKC